MSKNPQISSRERASENLEKTKTKQNKTTATRRCAGTTSACCRGLP